MANIGGATTVNKGATMVNGGVSTAIGGATVVNRGGVTWEGATMVNRGGTTMVSSWASRKRTVMPWVVKKIQRNYHRQRGHWEELWRYLPGEKPWCWGEDKKTLDLLLLQWLLCHLAELNHANPDIFVSVSICLGLFFSGCVKASHECWTWSLDVPL